MMRREEELANPSISVIVPAYNEEAMIADCLRALLRQDYDGAYEIIVVENGSTDATGETARSFGDSRIRVVREPRRGYVNALRRGVRTSSGQILAFTDADTRVPAGWLTALVSRLSEDGVVACAGVFGFFDGPAWMRWLGRIAGRANWHLAGANMAVWRDAYEEAGGFDPQVNLGADLLLDLRLRRIGKVVIDRQLAAMTSSRRFLCAPVSALGRYFLNDAALLLAGRPLFPDFPNYRLSAFSGRKTASALGFGISLLLAAFFLACELPGSQIFGHVVAHGGKVPAVALTFDDGPSPATEEILRILDGYHIKATFFLIGENAARHPGGAARIVAGGHCLGNHTWSHPLLAPVESGGRLGREIDDAQRAIRQATGVAPELFRPPHGWRSPAMMRECGKRHLTVVTWTVDSCDWKGVPADEVVRRVLKEASPGSIILLHDGRGIVASPNAENTVEALPRIIEGLAHRGYRFATVADLLDEEAAGKKVPSQTADGRD